MFREAAETRTVYSTGQVPRRVVGQNLTHAERESPQDFVVQVVVLERGDVIVTSGNSCRRRKYRGRYILVMCRLPELERRKRCQAR